MPAGHALQSPGPNKKLPAGQGRREGCKYVGAEERLGVTLGVREEESVELGVCEVVEVVVVEGVPFGVVVGVRVGVGVGEGVGVGVAVLERESVGLPEGETDGDATRVKV